MTLDQAEYVYSRTLRDASASDQYNVAVCFAKGVEGCPVDIEKAKNLMIKSAERGYEPAIYFTTKILPKYS